MTRPIRPLRTAADTGTAASTAPESTRRRDVLRSLAVTAATGAGAALGLAGGAQARTASPAPVPAGVDLSKVTLRVGTYKGGWRALLGSAQLLDTPYRVEWRELNNGVLHIEALNGDALDIGSGSEIPALFAARQKAQARFIAIAREDLNNQVTLARKDAPIQRIADLKGKRVGYVRATTSHYFLARQLAEAGLSFADITPVSLTPADGLSAFERGDLDAWAIYGYNGQIARLRYGARTLKTGVGYLSGNFPIYANPRALEDRAREAAIGDWLLRLRTAYHRANGQFLSFARAQNAETRVPVGDLVELWNRRSTDYDLRPVTPDVVAQHQRVADTFLQLGVLDGPAQVAPLWDSRYSGLLRAGGAAQPVADRSPA